MKQKQHGLIIAVHTLLIIAAYSSPFWLDWRLILLGIIIYYTQLVIFGWCVLSTAQFGERRTFHEWYLAKLGFHPNPRMLHFALDYVIPPGLVMLGYLLQH
ncbi:MAG: hypothetical protein WAW63_02080 [Candidatus Saccharimonadales bacterium]|jgi:hypothetical protein